MISRLAPSSKDDLAKIHRAALRLLNEAGVAFPGGPALNVFRDHGFRTKGDLVFITEEQLFRHLATVPKTVPMVARNPEKSCLLGGPAPLLFGFGAPIKILSADGSLHPITTADFQAIHKLTQTSPLPQISSYKATSPADIPGQTAHLELFFHALTMTDLVAGGDAMNAANTRDTLNMLGLVFGGTDFLRRNTVVRVTVSPMSPLSYGPDQSASLMMLAENNQLTVVSDMAMMGLTSPVDLPATLAVCHAEILAGIVLTQLVCPGAPAVYGNTSSSVDMKGVVATLGTPETIRLARCTIELARDLGLPSRTGGGLTDSLALDGQAAAEAALGLQSCLASGVDLIMHAFGMMGGFTAASLEKWVLDEELISFIMASMKPLDMPDEIDVGEVIALGPGANYLTRPSTFNRFREFHQFRLFNKLPWDMWRKKGPTDLAEVCRREVERRLAAYEKPPMDPKLETELARYVKTRQAELL